MSFSNLSTYQKYNSNVFTTYEFSSVDYKYSTALIQVITTTGYNTNLWFHPQISLGYSRRVETTITKITKNNKNNNNNNNNNNNYNYNYILYVTKLPNTQLKKKRKMK